MKTKLLVSFTEESFVLKSLDVNKSKLSAMQEYETRITELDAKQQTISIELASTKVLYLSSTGLSTFLLLLV